MNKTFKRILTLLICLSTFLELIPIGAYAADSQIGQTVYITEGTWYTSPSGKKESTMNVSNGKVSYCIDWNVDFVTGNAVVHDALEYFSQENLNIIYAAKVLSGNDMWSFQCMLWKYFNNNDVCSVYGISEASVDNLYNKAKAAKDNYIGYGYVYEMTSKAQRNMSIWGETKGYLKLQKSSSNTSITDGNNCYSLAGAVYGVYSDSNCSSLSGKLTTDANGNSNTLALKTGTYYIKEITAPKNYEISQDVITVKVTTSNTSSSPALVKTSDVPGNDPLTIEINKIDKLTKDLYNGDVNSLEGAEFTIKYFDNTTGDVNGDPNKTWIIKSLFNKYANRYVAVLGDMWKVGGDEYYKNLDGNNVLPVGTYLVEETKSPEHYVLDNTKVSTKGMGVVEGTKVIGVVNDSTSNWKINFGNELEYMEQVGRGEAHRKLIKRQREIRIKSGEKGEELGKLKGEKRIVNRILKEELRKEGESIGVSRDIYSERIKSNGNLFYGKI